MNKRIRIHGFTIVRGALLSLLIVGTGCGLFDPKGGGPPPPPPFQYKDLSTPQNVVQNLKDSWERRDTTRTNLIYDDTYVGTSTDNTGSVTFTKRDEVLTVAGMAKSQNINHIYFTLRPETTWVRLTYPGDPVGWTAIDLQGVDIQVDDAVLGTQIANSSSFFEFKFAPTLDSKSPTDTTWKIVKWEEIRN